MVGHVLGALLGYARCMLQRRVEKIQEHQREERPLHAVESLSLHIAHLRRVSQFKCKHKDKSTLRSFELAVNSAVGKTVRYTLASRDCGLGVSWLLRALYIATAIR